MKTIKHFKYKKTKFITPLGVGSHLKGWGIEKSRIFEKDWWAEANFNNIRFIAAPSQHFSGRDGVEGEREPGCSRTHEKKRKEREGERER